MIWSITIATFLAAVVAAMQVFLVFCQRKQRREARIPMRVGLELASPDDPLIYEIAFTENVSRHGARVVTKRRRRPNDGILVKLPQESLPSRARITYFEPLKGDEFAIGLQFSLAVYGWIGSSVVRDALPRPVFRAR